jgi:polyhydroxybutyrate depolymerase
MRSGNSRPGEASLSDPDWATGLPAGRGSHSPSREATSWLDRPDPRQAPGLSHLTNGRRGTFGVDRVGSRIPLHAHRSWTAALLLTACLVGCGGGSGSGLASRNVAGTYYETLNVDGVDREFIVYVPALAANTAKAPVVFMFHGTSGDGQKFYDLSLWVQTADQYGLIAVFPSALYYAFYEDDNQDGIYDKQTEAKFTTKWDAGKLGNEFQLFTQQEINALPPVQRVLANHPLLDDVHFVEAMLTHLEAAYSIDPSRIYASGFSNGGELTSRLMLHLADRFAGLASAAGLMYRPFVMGPTNRLMPVVFSVGSLDDRYMPLYGGGPLPVDETFLDEPLAKFIIVEPYLEALDLEDVYAYDELMVGGQKVARFRYTTHKGAGTNEFQLLVMEGVEHFYPNGSNHPVALAPYLWSFWQPGP